MIKRLRIENWKSHLSTELNFDVGPNVLVGIMGSGKTSVVEAVSFALFGTFPSLQSKKTALDELLMSRPERKDSAGVEMDFESGGKNYTIRREIRRGKGSRAEVREDGKLVEVNPRNVTETVSKILGMDYELFSKAVYSEQNGIDYFLRIPKGRRMEHIDRMLKLDRYERAREGCVALKNKVKTRASELMRVIEDLERTRPQEQLAKVEREMSALRGERARLAKDVAVLERERKGFESRLEQLEARNKEVEKTKTSLESVKAVIEEMEISIRQRRERVKGKEMPKDLDAARAELKGLEEQAERWGEREKELRERLATLNTGMRMLREKDIPELHKRHEEKEAKEKRLKGIDKRFPDIEADLGKCKGDIEERRRKISELESRRLELKRHLGMLKGRRCPTCEQEVAEELRQGLESRRKRELSSIESQISEKKGKLEKQGSLLEKMEAALKEQSLLMVQVKDYGDIESRLSELERTVKDSREKVKALVEEIGKVSKQTREIEEGIKKKTGEIERAESLVEEARTLRELEKRREESIDKKAGLEKKLGRLEEVLKGVDISSLRKEFTEKSSEQAAASARLSSLSEMVKEKESLVEEIRERVKTLEEYKENVEESERAMDVLERLGGVLSLTQQQLREEFIKSVNSIMNSLWPDIYPYGDFSEVRLGVDGDYVLQLRRGNVWISADGIASGGERSLACLVLRIAFSLAFMPKLRWLILDEPTHNLDRNAVERLAEVIRERWQAFAEQVFVITHDERLSEGLPSIRLERDKASGGHTRVIRESWVP